MRNFFSRKEIVVLLWFLLTVTAASLARSPLCVLLLLVGGLLYRAMAYGREFFGGLVALLLLVAVSAVVCALVVHRGHTVFLFVNGKPVTAEAVAFGVTTGCTVVALVLFCGVFSRLFADRWLTALHRLPRTAVTLMLGVRYVPLAMRRARQAMAAQKALGALSADSVVSRLRFSLGVYASVFARMLVSSVTAADVLRARGYDGKIRLHGTPWRCADVVLLVVLLLAAGLLCAAAFTNGFAFSFYPTLDFTLSVGSACALVACALLAFLPTLYDAVVAAVLCVRLKKGGCHD